MAVPEQVTIQGAHTTKIAAETVMNNAATVDALNTNAMLVSAFGYQFNLMTVVVVLMLAGILYAFYRIQKSGKLDFTDMVTKDGRKVSSTKVLQLLAGLSSTWFILKTGLQGTLSAEIFGIYLTYIASVEGFAKFMAAKYNYTETSVKDATAEDSK